MLVAQNEGLQAALERALIASDMLEEAKQVAMRADASKSRFLAAASHDLRQPLQSIALLQGLLAREVTTDRARKLVERLDGTLVAMSGMLNAMLDINQIEAGTVRAQLSSFVINDLLTRLRDEFSEHAQHHAIDLRIVPCSQIVTSDPNLLEQIIRNLLSNALKYTVAGKVLIGCRKRDSALVIEVWDTGIGIPMEALTAIFEEYHQLDNDARERERGLGLGLSLVKRLGALLKHDVGVQSVVGRGSKFSITVLIDEAAQITPILAPAPPVPKLPRTGTLLIIEDDLELRALLAEHFREDGHRIHVAGDGVAALTLLDAQQVEPDVILSDFNLPGGMDGLAVLEQLRAKLGRMVPVIFLTGDISTRTIGRIARANCVQLSKPVKLRELRHAIQRLLPIAREPSARRELAQPIDHSLPITYIVDDDPLIRDDLCGILIAEGHACAAFASCEAFLLAYQPGGEACLLVDGYLPGMNGIELIKQLRDAGHHLPAIMITGSSDVTMAVDAMKAGASDFIEKPVRAHELLAGVGQALAQSRDSDAIDEARSAARAHLADLTPRQLEIMTLVLAGHPSKNIAVDLNLSQRTVENHRAAIMKKTASRSLPALARLVVLAQVS